MTTVGLEIAQNVFQVHGVDRHGTVVPRKRLARESTGAHRQPAALSDRLEACGGVPDWARELSRLGHEVA